MKFNRTELKKKGCVKILKENLKQSAVNLCLGLWSAFLHNNDPKHAPLQTWRTETEYGNFI